MKDSKATINQFFLAPLSHLTVKLEPDAEMHIIFAPGSNSYTYNDFINGNLETMHYMVSNKLVTKIQILNKSISEMFIC